MPDGAGEPGNDGFLFDIAGTGVDRGLRGVEFLAVFLVALLFRVLNKRAAMSGRSSLPSLLVFATSFQYQVG